MAIFTRNWIRQNMKCVEHLFGEFNWFAHVTGVRTTLLDLKGIVATCAAMVQEGHKTMLRREALL
jgi:hypothetical protein